jgi:hypothetical protein
MKIRTTFASLSGPILTALLIAAPAPAWAHCDGLDGPVVKAAQRALEMRDPALALMWVQAIETGSLEPVERLLTEAMQARLREHFAEVIAAKAFMPSSVARGRAYVSAYVQFIHFVERLYEASVTGAHGHFEEAPPAAAGHR